MDTNTLLFYAMIVFMILTLASILVGLIQSIMGTSKSPLNAQKAMRARILCQGIAILIFGILTFTNKG